MTNKIQLITAIAIATILVTSGFSLTPEAFSTGSSGGDKDKKWDDKKDKEGGFDFNKFKTWKNNHDDNDHDDKIKICHIPPGNPDAAHTITISKAAWDAHKEHGDTLGACPNDDDDEDGEEDPATITFLRAITNDNGKAIVDMDFTISIDGMPIQTGTPIEVTPNTEHMISGTVQEGFSFVLIAGESECPSTLAADSFKVKEGKSVICTIYYDDDFVEGQTGSGGPGVVFHYETIQLTVGPASGRNCETTENIPPCIELIDEKTFIVRPDLSEAPQDLTPTTLILLSVLPDSNFALATQCTVSGLNAMGTTIDGFGVKCLDTSAGSDPFNVYNFNLALIETAEPEP